MTSRPFTETPLQRLQSIAEWTHTSENTRVSIRKEDLQYAVQKLAQFELMLGSDIDLLDAELPDIAADLSQEEAPL